MINVAVGINMEGNGNCAGFFPQKPSGYRAAKYTVKDNLPLILSLAVIDQSLLFLILIVTLNTNDAANFALDSWVWPVLFE